jgi:hypothetical protein
MYSSVTLQVQRELEHLLSRRASLNRAIASLEKYDHFLKHKGGKPAHRKTRAGGVKHQEFLQ